MERHIAAIRGVRDLIARPPGDTAAGQRLALNGMSEVLGLGRNWLFLPDASGLLRADEAGGAECHIGAAQPLAAILTEARLVAPAEPADLPAELIRFLRNCGAGPVALTPLREGAELVGVLCLELPDSAPPQGEKARNTLAMIDELAALLLDQRHQIAQDAQRAEASAQMAALLHAMPDLLFEVDAQARYTSFIGGPRDLLMHAPHEIVARPVEEILPPDVVQIAHRVVTQVVSTGEVAEAHYALGLPGDMRHFSLRAARKAPVVPGGAPSVLLMVRDVTAKQEMREELLRLSSVTRAMSNLVIMVDTDLRITWVNQAFEKRSGWSLAEIRGRIFADVMRCDDSDPRVAAELACAMAEERPYNGIMINCDRNGTRYHVDFNVVPLRNGQGRLQGFVSVETEVTELHNQKRQLEELARQTASAQSRLVNAINAVPDGMMVFDAERRMVMCNPAQIDAFPRLAPMMQAGVKLQEILLALTEHGYLEPPPVGMTAAAYLNTLMQPYGQASYNDELRMHDGRVFRRVNKPTADGGLLTAMIEITAQKRHVAELDNANERLWRALEERELAEQRLSNIMDENRVGTWALDLTKREMTAGRHWGRIIGHEGPVTMAHGDFLAMVHPEDRPLLESDAPRVSVQSPDGFENEFRIRHRDGHWLWVLSRGRVTRWDETGRPLLVDGVDIDVSAQKRLEMEVRQSDALLKSALESNVAAVAIYDSNDVMIYCNPEAERILHLRPGLICGKPSEGQLWNMERMNGEPLPAEEGPCNMARRAGTLLRDLRYTVRWNDGRRQVLTCNATPFKGGDGQMNTAVSFWDSTEEIAVTERLQEAVTHAEAMSRSKSIFLANMSHEIRTPLNGVLGLAEVLSMQIKDPEHSRMIATIRRSGETLLSVLNTILDMSKIEAGKVELEHMPLRLIDILNQLEGVYSVLAEEKGLDFEVSTSAGAELMRIGDPHRIQQIVGNLLSNAIKFASQGGVSLDVSCRPGKPVVFTIVDTGIGMTPDQCDRVFSSFEQADETVSRRHGGTGLGLSIVRELVNLSGGTIALVSEFGVGTKVEVTLPLPMADAETRDLSPVVTPSDATADNLAAESHISASF
ncbi:PAS domain-containing protein [Xinfangfangia sp. CPCC 101601]|uniref:histidine kinase n=1 Tax=Pseudogemmobacter lacusdianii TaxID=3069608 RepID=A0ABU0VTN1_9RHOB|nr:PAS domain-containing protein [Xinfangfangia sp. CPCC 101601]MDQ2065089.1 PAS domain-containing protein [Xinfangfangia sp. CPCC 101601]